jgi:hypothetical protein
MDSTSSALWGTWTPSNLGRSIWWRRRSGEWVSECACESRWRS